VIAHPVQPLPHTRSNRLAANALMQRKDNQFTPCAVCCQHRFENIFLAPVIISKTPVFAGVFDVFWVVTIFAPDADHRYMIRGIHGMECGSVWVCECEWREGFGSTGDRQIIAFGFCPASDGFVSSELPLIAPPNKHRTRIAITMLPLLETCCFRLMTRPFYGFNTTAPLSPLFPPLLAVNFVIVSVVYAVT
jgi:hypothetical protein